MSSITNGHVGTDIRFPYSEVREISAWPESTSISSDTDTHIFNIPIHHNFHSVTQDANTASAFLATGAKDIADKLDPISREEYEYYENL